jgi:hypothetical protein
VAHVSDDARDKSHYQFKELFGEDAFFDTLEDVEQAYQVEQE